MSYWGFKPYKSVAKKQAQAERIIKSLRKKNKNINPIVVSGTGSSRRIASTWWGNAWNKNLELYADYRYRAGRGRSYVRCGSVIDLNLDAGFIRSLVAGSQSTPYSVEIKIKVFSDKNLQKIKKICAGQISSLNDLLEGRFPKTLEEMFTSKGVGLFPAPEEIDFSCTCPDWASMCKHVAATLYGVGVCLDEKPELFFCLRKIKIEDLITQAVQSKTEKLLKKAEKKSGRIIKDKDLSSIFGVELDAPLDIKKKTVKKIKTRSGSTKKKQKKKEKATTAISQNN